MQYQTYTVHNAEGTRIGKVKALTAQMALRDAKARFGLWVDSVEKVKTNNKQES